MAEVQIAFYEELYRMNAAPPHPSLERFLEGLLPQAPAATEGRAPDVDERGA